ncbi:MAG: twin-arginine translocation signal domain-containing protein [Gloeomargarita sp. SKYG116]|nr:twin-arginine translocation signal domain-containing protein [Gloeomargarita sp. SKYG116]MDW8401379.1 twin-arginine translocation signal domain-containing protein [Gloeomargarita sp. SKYGB_i_bin116]
MAGNTERRNLLKAALIAAGAMLPAGIARAQQKLRQTLEINPQAKAVMPDGKILSREMILQRLGLDPKTPPDAWLTIVRCGSNAAALGPERLQNLIREGKLKLEDLDPEVQQRLKQMPAPKPR